MIPFGIFLDGAVALFRRHKSLFIIAPLAIALAWQTWQVGRWKNAAEKWETAHAAQRAASQANRELAKALVARDQAKHNANKERSDKIHAQELSQAYSSLDRFMAANRVWRQEGVRGGHTPASGQGQDSGSREELPDSAIMVSEADLRICTARTADTIATYEYFQGLKRDGLAE